MNSVFRDVKKVQIGEAPPTRPSTISLDSLEIYILLFLCLFPFFLYLLVLSCFSWGSHLVCTFPVSALEVNFKKKPFVLSGASPVKVFFSSSVPSGAGFRSLFTASSFVDVYASFFEGAFFRGPWVAPQSFLRVFFFLCRRIFSQGEIPPVPLFGVVGRGGIAKTSSGLIVFSCAGQPLGRDSEGGFGCSGACVLPKSSSLFLLLVVKRKGGLA